MIQAQTIQPDMHIIVDDIHDCNYPDVTWRYKLGFQRAREQGADVFVIMEDDDWYAPNYIEVMLTEWVRRRKPNLFGIANTIYYHLALRKYRIITHPRRASMMATVIRADTEIEWCADDYPYLDVHMWTELPSVTIATKVFDKTITIGIKHGNGLYAGGGHNKDSQVYKTGYADPDMKFLESHVGSRLVRFYKTIAK